MPATPATRGGLEMLAFERFAALGATIVVTTRHGGVSAAPYDSLNLGAHVGDDAAAVAENRRRLAHALGLEAGALAIATQVHGTDIAIVRGAGGAVGSADVLVTDDAAVALCVLVADCVPLAVVDPVARVLAVGHAGWRGTAASVATVMLGALEALGGEPNRAHAAVGPCISGRTYQVGDDVARALLDAGGGDFITPDGTGRHLADLSAINAAQLVRGGVPVERVDVAGMWTDGGGTFFSDRAQRPCGRFALAAMLTHGDS